MLWLDKAIRQILAHPVCGYQRNARPAVEPTSLTALALLAINRGSDATAALDWLLAAQSPDGSLGLDADTHQPCWPTGWAALAWNNAAREPRDAKSPWATAAQRAIAWLLKARAVAMPRSANMEDDRQVLGHDITLHGWPWAQGTHSWVEPTAINLLALRGAGKTDHPFYHEAVKMLLNRQLPAGGWNFGNTTVLGHMLRPQVQPTGLALAALAGQPRIRDAIQPSVDYLRQSLSRRTTAASLAYALIGLAVHELRAPNTEDLLASAYERTLENGGSPYSTALLVLAAKREAFAHSLSDRAAPSGLPRS